MGKRKNNKRRRKEEFSEDYCFICKDGGQLRICDFRNCPKTYHAKCVHKDDSFLTNDDYWCCGSHYCYICRRKPKFMCLCCPKAVCGKCYNGAEFAYVKRNKGFCGNCSKLAFLVEENADVDSDGEKIDLKDPNTIENYFLVYYESIKKKEGLSSQQVHIARDIIKNVKNKRDLDSYEIGEGEDDTGDSDCDDLDYTEGVKSVRRKKCMKSIKGKAVNEKNNDFVGWGSRSLIDFLKNIGRDTTKAFTELDVASIIIDYCNKNNLFDPKKKRKIICDAKLRVLLRRKSVNKNNIQNLLASHFAENFEGTDDIICGSEEMDNNEAFKFPKQRNLNSATESCQSVVSEKLPSEFAAIMSSNLKLVYLKKSLIEELWKQPETFDDKVLGSFVRTKSDPNDYLQKNSHLLLQVIGINRNEINQEILLQLSNVPKAVPLSKISDDDFSEEECQDLYQRMTNGQLKKPTILELEQKARTLHEDIIKHWISREIVLIGNRIDLANEKGWRRLLPQYLDQKQKLESPSEQSRLLGEIPKVIPEMVDTNLSPEKFSRNGKVEQIDLPEFAIVETCNSGGQCSTRDGFAQCLDKVADVVGPKTPVKNYQDDTTFPAIVVQVSVHTASQEKDTSKSLIQYTSKSRDDCKHALLKESISDYHTLNPAICDLPQPSNTIPASADVDCKNNKDTSQINLFQYTLTSQEDRKPALLKESNSDCQTVNLSANMDVNQTVKERQRVMVADPVKPTVNDVIVLSDSDEEDVNIKVTSAERKAVENPDISIWHCSGIHGSVTKGPFSMSVLKRWSESGSTVSPLNYKVWKTGESEREAILLNDALKLFFP